MLRETPDAGIGAQTADGKFSIHEAECLGSCGTAPLFSINKQYHDRLSPEKIKGIIGELQGEV